MRKVISKSKDIYPTGSTLYKELDEHTVSASPFSQFKLWMREAIKLKLLNPDAMILATANKKGIPSARVVLLKGYDEKGFVFFTNYESDKARELSENPNATLLFFWNELVRQVRISGKVKLVSKEESQSYFATRPRNSQLGAWASNQSSVIANREYLEQQFEVMKKKFSNQDVPLPPFWGGYRVIPRKFEFWHGRDNRLHDRICYKLKMGKWKIERLAP